MLNYACDVIVLKALLSLVVDISLKNSVVGLYHYQGNSSCQTISLLCYFSAEDSALKYICNKNMDHPNL